MFTIDFENLVFLNYEQLQNRADEASVHQYGCERATKLYIARIGKGYDFSRLKTNMLSQYKIVTACFLIRTQYTVYYFTVLQMMVTMFFLLSAVPCRASFSRCILLTASFFFTCWQFDHIARES